MSRRSRRRSLDQLEPDRRPAPAGAETRLTETVRELRRKPIGDPTVEDLRLLISQDVGLTHLLPLAVEVLRVDPAAEGDFHPGDLLAAVLTRDEKVWGAFSALRREFRGIVSEPADIPPDLRRDVERFLAG